MFYYLYEIKNNLNGKIYVGVHTTDDMNDSYMGSGKVINRAIQKYGIDNFTKVILELFEDTKTMYAREKEVVTEEFLSRDDVYNLRRGGYGGFDYINKHKDAAYFNTRSENGKKFNCKTTPILNPKWGPKYGKNSPFYGKKMPFNFSINESFRAECASKAMSAESQKKRLDTMIKNKHGQGEKNSQFGTCWIYHELIGYKKCSKNDIAEYIEQGWIKGRGGFKSFLIA